MSEELTGRALDQVVAERVMGYVWVHSNWENRLESPDMARILLDPKILVAVESTIFFKGRDETLPNHVTVPAFSTDIAAAWQVVERMRALGWRVQQVAFPGDGKRPYGCDMIGRDEYVSVARETGPLAICAAALAALGEGESAP